MEENRYSVCKYGRWHFGILDGTIGLLMRQGPNPDYSKPLDDKDSKLLLFKKIYIFIHKISFDYREFAVLHLN